MVVVALGTEHGSAVGGDGVELGIGSSNDNGAADGINACIGNAGGNEFAFNGERTEVFLDRGGGVVAAPVNRVDANAAGGECHVILLQVGGPSVFHDTMTPVSVAPSANFSPVLASHSLVTAKPMG